MASGPRTPAHIRNLLDSIRDATYASAATDAAVAKRGWCESGELVALKAVLAGGKPAFADAAAAAQKGDPSLMRTMMDGFVHALGIPASPRFAHSTRQAAEVTAATGVPAWWVAAPGVPEDAPIVLHLHGGGRVSGSTEPSTNPSVRALAAAYM